MEYKSGYFCECGHHEKKYYPMFETEEERNKANEGFCANGVISPECRARAPRGMVFQVARYYWGKFVEVADGYDTP